MTKAVFDTRAGSGYDDDITRTYPFPDRYLPVARQCEGDWILFRDPARRGRRKHSGYVAVARVERITPDPDKAGYSVASIGNFLAFETSVPLNGPDGAYEQILRDVHNRALRGVALQGRSLRTISDEDFAVIVQTALSESLHPGSTADHGLDIRKADDATRALIELPPLVQRRRIREVLMNRPIRDACFRRNVLRAYRGRCAVTGLLITDDTGGVEAQAAHIRPVQDDGPDVVQNGLALSGTIHWLFDRHMIALTDDLRLLVSERVPNLLRDILQGQVEGIHRPDDRSLWPGPTYTAHHREAFLRKNRGG